MKKLFAFVSLLSILTLSALSYTIYLGSFVAAASASGTDIPSFEEAFYNLNVKSWFSESFSNAFRSITGYASATSCSSLSQSECRARTDCCWSPFWEICRGTGESCCHDIACQVHKSDPSCAGGDCCYSCPNDVLDCYVCSPASPQKDEWGWVNKCETGEINYGVQYPYDTSCKGKQIGDSCDSDGITDAHCTSFCSCGYVDSVEDPVHPLQIGCTLPDNVCQQGDGIGGYLVGCSESYKPAIRIVVDEGGCVIDGSTTAGRYYCSGSSCGCEFGWNFPQLPAGCLGKTVTVTVSSEGKSTSKTVKFSSDPTIDNPPDMPRFGTWNPDKTNTYLAGLIFPDDIVSYTAYATDDKGLKEIQIYKFEETPTPGYKLVKTCPVSGTSASCTITGGPYSGGTEIAYKGSAVDTKGQVVPYRALGARRDSASVCNWASDTDNGLNYATKGTCKSCDHADMNDFCLAETPPNYCCSMLEGRWEIQGSISADGTATCCKLEGGKGVWSCTETRVVNCKGTLGEYYANDDKKTCGLEYHECSGEGKTCQGGKCVAAGGTTTTTTIQRSTTTAPQSTTTTPQSTTTTPQSTTTVSQSTTTAQQSTTTTACTGQTAELVLHRGPSLIGVAGLSQIAFGSCEPSFFTSSSGTCVYDNNGIFVYYNRSLQNKGDCGRNFSSAGVMKQGLGYYVYANKECRVTACLPDEVDVVLHPGHNLIAVPVDTSLDDIAEVCGDKTKLFEYFPSSSGTCIYDARGYFVYYDYNSGVGDCGGHFSSDSRLRQYLGYYVYFKGKNGDGVSDCTLQYRNSELVLPNP